MELVYCGACSHSQAQHGYCERCGAELHEDGSCSYDASERGIQDAIENIDFYDSGCRDRDEFYRKRGREYYD